MNIVDILAKKRDAQALTADEIAFLVKGAVDGSIADYQVTAFLMAGRIHGFTKEETLALTMEMAHSGEMIDLSDVEGIKVDKHSTGGVGDKTSLILLPIIAAAGLKGAKMSGRGLGHTGGTLDKLASIPGFRCDLAIDTFKEQVRKTGLSIISQTDGLVPADKLFYALRDVTATVDSIPLITASIMSKKLAMGADVLVLDVKYGSGALIKDEQESRMLGEMMVEVAKGTGMKAAAMLTSMEQPLGMAVGNALEVKEVLDVLHGEGPQDLREVAFAIAAEMMLLAGLKQNRAEARAYAAEIVQSGAALQKFEQMVLAQGGSTEFDSLPVAEQIIPLCAEKAGYIGSFDTAAIGHAAMLLGAGRRKKTDSIDPATGLIVPVKLGDRVTAEQPLAYLHINNTENLQDACRMLKEAICIQEDVPQKTAPLILDIIN